MEILDISHIQHYPIGGENALKFLYTKTEKYANREVGIAVGIGNVASPYIDLKIGKDIHRLCLNSLNHSVFPLLYPPSCLYSAMEDGSVPIVELFKLYETRVFDTNKKYQVVFNTPIISYEWAVYDTIKKEEGILKFIRKTSNMGDLVHSFRYDPELRRFSMYDDTNRRPLGVAFQTDLFQYLFERHIDVFGLIPKGLARDITTLNNQTK